MIAQELIQFAANNSGISNSETIHSFLNQAAQELWNSEDFPGTLQEESFQPYAPGVPFVSLPYYIQAIRGIRPCRGMTTDLGHKATAVMDDRYIYSPWKWRHVKKTPLIRDIEEASQLTIKRTLPTATDEVIITLAGPSDVADQAEESLLFTANINELKTTNGYEDLVLLAKNVISDCNFEVRDSAGNLVAVLPNHYLEVNNTVIQITDTCNQQVIASNCVFVLYKPYLPPILRDTDPIPHLLEQALYFKFLEWLDLHTTDKLQRAELNAIKSQVLQNKAAFIADRGQNKPFNMRRNVFTPYAGYRI
jgi:hypothetical protein